MKSVIAFFCCSFLTVNAICQNSEKKSILPDADKAVQVVEVSCGKCKLGLPGKSCDLAVRIDGKAYYVDGAAIDDFGDAHAREGFCNAIRKAEVQGEVVGDRFKLTYIKLIKESKKKNAKENKM